jgi:hypothetical protein
VTGGHDALTACFEQQMAAWFGGGGRRQVSDRAQLRQMNMALALALSRWLELADREDAVPAMRNWLSDVERRAVARRAEARAEAIRQTRAWFDACA